jgi:aspartyl-tRNA(Asn)/glutamyl-tRNA(Gln) amidotransferase subunit B
VKGLSLNPLHIADLIKLTNEGVISGLVAKEVLRQNIDTGKDPAVIVKQKGLEQVSDKGELDLIIEDVINSNKKSVDDFKNGKDNAISFLVGQVMKISRGKANPKLANELLRAKLGE